MGIAGKGLLTMKVKGLLTKGVKGQYLSTLLVVLVIIHDNDGLDRLC